MITIMPIYQDDYLPPRLDTTSNHPKTVPPPGNLPRSLIRLNSAREAPPGESYGSTLAPTTVPTLAVFMLMGACSLGACPTKISTLEL